MEIFDSVVQLVPTQAQSILRVFGKLDVKSVYYLCVSELFIGPMPISIYLPWLPCISTIDNFKCLLTTELYVSAFAP